MPYKGDRRSIVIAATILFIIGFSYGVYRSFIAMEGTQSLDRAQHDISAPQPTPSDRQDGSDRASDGTDPLDSLDDVPGVVQGYDVSPESGLPENHSDDVYYLGVHENRVAAFVGPPVEGRVLRITERLVDTLPPREVASLRQGIRIVGESAMLEALEGYMH